MAEAIAMFGCQRHRLQADRFERSGNLRLRVPGQGEFASLDLGRDLTRAATIERRPARQQDIERRAQTVDITGRPDFPRLPGVLLRAHETRGADDPTRL